MDLFGGEKDVESTSKEGFKINKAYAASYELWREKEELQKLKDRYDGDEDVESSESSDSDDLDPEDLNPEEEKKFLNVLSALKGKDPRIYDVSSKFFGETLDVEEQPEKISNKNKKANREKDAPMFLKDYERKLILEKQGKFVDEEVDSDTDTKNNIPYVVQQQQLKESFRIKIAENDDDNEEFLKPRIKSKEEQVKEDADYIEWLKGRKQEVGEGADKKQLKHLRDYWNSPNLNEGEKFLKDYLLNRRYLDDDDEEGNEIPSYADVVADDEEDEKIVEAQEKFEHKYNFRFEEPDDEFIKSYPRTVKDSLRRKDENKKRKRELYKEKKEKEKEQKREELKRLKNLKRKEITEKLKKVKMITGHDDLPLDPDEFERDFDPAEYDKKMAKLFNDDYYARGADEDEKPTFTPSESDDTDEETFEKWSGQKNNESEFEFESETPNTSAENDTKKRKTSSKLVQALKRKKPIFDPEEKTFEEYFDEYYKLDYEDIIGGDTLCRFKYRKVVANDFGLTTEEILNAKPQELNAWVSVRKMSQYRDEQDEAYDVSAYKKKAQDDTRKRKILSSVFKTTVKNEEEETRVSTNNLNDQKSSMKNNKKKKKQKQNDKVSNEEKIMDANNYSNITSDDTMEVNKSSVKQSAESTNTKKNRKKKRQQNVSVNNKSNDKIQSLPDERLKAYGLNPKKIKNKMKYKKH